MISNLWNKLKESFMAVLPISIVVILISVILCPLKADIYIAFGISAILMILGIALFSLGSDISMTQMGSNIGKSLCKSKKLSLMLICTAFIGFIITFAEPDLAVLAKQIADMGIMSEQYLFISVVSIGVGVFLLLAILKVVFRWKLSIILAIGYSLLFMLCFFVPDYLVPIAFDSGSVTTGPISVPFLISFGLGISSISSSNDKENALGYIAMSSLGPIVAVMILGMFLPKDVVITTTQIVADETTNIFALLGTNLLEYFKDVAITLLPIIVIFLIFQFTMLKLSKTTLWKILIGLVYTYFGVVLFLTGVNTGYLPVASALGKGIASGDHQWVLIPLSLILGYFIIAAEPAVHVLKKEVEEVTNGKLKQKTILTCVSIGVAFSVLLAMLMTLYSIPLIALLIPIYLACIILSFYNGSLFVAIAFDAGGTATGAMAVSFVLPFITGVASIVNPNTTGFGTIALIACMPILALQILGAVFTTATKRATRKEKRVSKIHVEIIDFE